MANPLPARLAEPPTDGDPRSHHPATVGFLNRVAELEDAVERQRQQIDADAVEKATQRARIEHLERELARASIERDKYSSGFFFLQAELAVVTSHAANSARTIADHCAQALDMATDEMRKNGLLKPSTDTAAAAIDDNLEKLGRTFGANARTDAEGKAAA